jgi:N-formylglutamate amidohydrolase
MASYEHVPICKTAMDLAVYLDRVELKFSRYHKCTLGSDLREQSRESVTMIIRAHSRREKVPVLYELRERLESLLVMLRIGQEVRRRFSLLWPMGVLVVTSPQAVCEPARWFL